MSIWFSIHINLFLSICLIWKTKQFVLVLRFASIMFTEAWKSFIASFFYRHLTSVFIVVFFFVFLFHVLITVIADIIDPLHVVITLIWLHEFNYLNKVKRKTWQPQKFHYKIFAQAVDNKVKIKRINKL